MSEEKIVEVVNEALAAAGIEDTVTAAGEFEPRGHSGAGFAGGMIGGDIGDAIGSAAGGIGTVGGYLAGTQAHDAATGLPERMVLGVSATTVYGFAGNRAHPKALVFRVPREGLEAQGPPARECAGAGADRYRERFAHRARGYAPADHPLQGRDPGTHLPPQPGPGGGGRGVPALLVGKPRTRCGSSGTSSL